MADGKVQRSPLDFKVTTHPEILLRSTSNRQICSLIIVLGSPVLHSMDPETPMQQWRTRFTTNMCFLPSVLRHVQVGKKFETWKSEGRRSLMRVVTSSQVITRKRFSPKKVPKEQSPPRKATLSPKLLPILPSEEDAFYYLYESKDFQDKQQEGERNNTDRSHLVWRCKPSSFMQHTSSSSSSSSCTLRGFRCLGVRSCRSILNLPSWCAINECKCLENISK